MFDPANFTVSEARPLPVFLLLDVSASMSGDKIDSLNEAVRRMLETFAGEEAPILLSIIVFGGQARVLLPPTPALDVAWSPLGVSGATPMGGALTLAKAQIEDKQVTPSRAYRPTLILVSDGAPTDNWEKPMQALIEEGRSAKCDRMAMAIGLDADHQVLKEFIRGTSHELFSAADAADLHRFFRLVTMSVQMRSRSQTPNVIPSSITLTKRDEDDEPESVF